MSWSGTLARAAAAAMFTAGLLTAALLTPGSASVAIAAAPAPVPHAFPGQRFLMAADCVSTGNCWAVGWSENARHVTGTLTEHWNGTRWTVVASPSVAGIIQTILVSVSCASRSECWAVGYTLSKTGAEAPVAEYWHGKKWSLRALPEPTGNQSIGLSSVSCPTATRCWAVGRTNPGVPGEEPVVEHWNGRHWSIVPDSVAAGRGVPISVSCVSDATCWAAGERADGGTFAERWQGKKWSIVKTPGSGGLEAISCLRAACMAVGNTVRQFGLAERWSGSKWRVTPTPGPAGARLSFFEGVSCRSSSTCFLVGYYESKGFAIRTIIERWQRSAWTIIKSPEPSGRASATLWGVSCRAAPTCWVVGGQQKVADVSPSETLGERWNGARWSVVRTP